MKTIITFMLTLVISFNCFAECRPHIEKDLIKRITSQKKLAKAGKIATGAAFVTVGGFYGTMGVILVGPLLAGVAIGSTFGAAVALPIGATFIIINKTKKDQIKNLGKTLSIIGNENELTLLHEKLLVNHPLLTREELLAEIEELNSTLALCDGTVSHFDRTHRSKKRIIATPKDIYRFLDGKLALMNSTIS
jgi:hypothetical protein